MYIYCALGKGENGRNGWKRVKIDNEPNKACMHHFQDTLSIFTHSSLLIRSSSISTLYD